MGTNNGNHGKKGRSGRKSAYQENADAEELHRMFRDVTKVEEIRKRIASGKYSVKDVMQMKLLGGNDRLIDSVFKKLFPDLEKVDHSGGITVTVIDYTGKDGEKK